MPAPLRKKALQLPTSPVSPVNSPLEDLLATRMAPMAKKRPPALDGTINAGALSASNSAMDTGSRRHMSLTSTLRNLDIQSERKFDLKNEDLKNLQELGQGNGGSVMKVEHVPSGTIMAKKIVLIDAKPAVRKQILRELQIMHNCDSPYIISSYGSFLSEPNICICMEFMDKGSFDGIYKKVGAIDINIVGMVARSVLEGLTYLYNVHKIIHRDIKPSNILCNSHGDIKLCDFGVSGELINSIANTFVGTSIYMSPERIQGAEYSVKSDVWSLGITIIELAHGRFPFNDSYSDDSDLEDDPHTPTTPKTKNNRDSLQVPVSEAQARRNRRRSKGVSLHGGTSTMSIIELMHQIVKEPAPRLGPEGRFPTEAEDFVDACLLKEPDERKNPGDLIKYPWIETSKVSTVDFKAWVESF
ncbi:kinase-like domain-containing protein [Mycena floridula]|nr:kinase-like domain-containing protein [Mycena floridula]